MKAEAVKRAGIETPSGGFPDLLPLPLPLPLHLFSFHGEERVWGPGRRAFPFQEIHSALHPIELDLVSPQTNPPSTVDSRRIRIIAINARRSNNSNGT